MAGGPCRGARRAYAYDKNGNRLTCEYPNGVVNAYTYDALNRVETATTTDSAGGAVVYSVTYTYDTFNRLTGALSVRSGPAPTGPWVSYAVNFQPAESTPVDGWLVDAGEPYGERGNDATYGWTADVELHERGMDPDPLYDTGATVLDSGDEWEIEVPSGFFYEVRLGVGDPAAFLPDGGGVVPDPFEVTIGLEAQETTLTLGETEPTQLLEAIVRVEDGKLTLWQVSGGGPLCVCFIEVTTMYAASPESTETTFTAAYDYRTRRVLKSVTVTPPEAAATTTTTAFRYDGGVSYSEWIDADDDGSCETKSAAFVRGSGLGGGIGSILYSERREKQPDDSYQNVREYFAYSPAVGHVTATLTGDDPQGTIDVKSTNLYEAYGQVMSYDIATGWQIADPGQPTSGQSDNNRLANTKERDVVLGLDCHGFSCATRQGAHVQRGVPRRGNRPQAP